MDDQTDLLQRIEDYCRTAGIAESTFGKRSVNDGKFVGRLRDGKRVTTATVGRVRQFLQANGAMGPSREEPAPVPAPVALAARSLSTYAMLAAATFPFSSRSGMHSAHAGALVAPSSCAHWFSVTGNTDKLTPAISREVMNVPT